MIGPVDIKKHTPLPWQITGNFQRHYGVPHYSYTVNNGVHEPEECGANRMFIEQAVNNHDKLIAAMRTSMDLLDEVIEAQEMTGKVNHKVKAAYDALYATAFPLIRN